MMKRTWQVWERDDAGGPGGDAAIQEGRARPERVGRQGAEVGAGVQQRQQVQTQAVAVHFHSDVAVVARSPHTLQPCAEPAALRPAFPPLRHPLRPQLTPSSPPLMPSISPSSSPAPQSSLPLAIALGVAGRSAAGEQDHDLNPHQRCMTCSPLKRLFQLGAHENHPKWDLGQCRKGRNFIAAESGMEFTTSLRRARQCD